MSWAREKAVERYDGCSHCMGICPDCVLTAIRETIEEAARRACDCGGVKHHAPHCMAPAVLAMLEDK